VTGVRDRDGKLALVDNQDSERLLVDDTGRIVTSSWDSGGLPEMYAPAPSGDTTGATDSTALNAVLALLPSSGGHLTLLPGTYWVNAQIARAIDNVRITGAGNATIIKVAAGGTNHVFSLSGRTGWIISDLKIDLNGSTEPASTFLRPRIASWSVARSSEHRPRRRVYR
jgi:hypothetical protein